MKTKPNPTPAALPQVAPAPIINVNRGPWRTRITIGHPVTGNVRIEWVFARFGQITPCNWSHCDIVQFLSPYVPLQYQVADAENLIAKAAIENDSEWCLMYEHDNIPPTDAFVKLNEYMIDGTVPVVGGLYFTKSVPPEPILYRGAGRGYYADWKMGDKVWVSGVPFGFTLIHMSLIRAMWAESPEYITSGQTTRRIFHAPAESWSDPVKGAFFSSGGTSDLAWCKRVMDDGIFAKAGWPEYAKMENPFLIDTSIFVKHIDANGVQYPLQVPTRFVVERDPSTKL
ncbi:MAG: hypothetical protein NVS1B6_09290 [Steroidobacteraceae bacterium]